MILLTRMISSGECILICRKSLGGMIFGGEIDPDCRKSLGGMIFGLEIHLYLHDSSHRDDSRRRN